MITKDSLIKFLEGYKNFCIAEYDNDPNEIETYSEVLKIKKMISTFDKDGNLDALSDKDCIVDLAYTTSEDEIAEIYHKYNVKREHSIFSYNNIECDWMKGIDENKVISNVYFINPMTNQEMVENLYFDDLVSSTFNGVDLDDILSLIKDFADGLIPYYELSNQPVIQDEKNSPNCYFTDVIFEK